MSIRPERKMISSHARLEGRKACPFADFIYQVDRTAAVSNKHSPIRIKGDARSDAKIARKLFGFLERRHPIYGPVVAAGDKHLPAGTECQTRRVDHISEE